MAETTTKKLTTVLYTKYMLIKTDTTARELAPHYFPVDCFGGSSDMAETTTKKLTTVMYTKYVNNTKNYFPTEPNKLTQYFFFPAVFFSGHNFINEETCQKTQLIIFIFQNMKYGDI